MSNRDIYKDEFGNYHEVDEELEDPTDGFEDDEQDLYEDEDSDDPFDSAEDEDSDYYDEDEAYANDHGGNEYDADED